MNILTQMAAAEAPSGNLFEALGIDWKMLIFQIIGFVLLVWLLGKFVYPIFMKTVDERQEAIEAGAKAAEAARKQAEDASKKVAAALSTARKEAKDIVATAKSEATAAIEAAEVKAGDRAKRIVEDAQEQINKDVIAARKVLHNETIDLVSLATEKVIGKTVTESIDRTVVSAALKEAK